MRSRQFPTPNLLLHGQVQRRTPHVADALHAIGQEQGRLTRIPVMNVHVCQTRQQELATPIDVPRALGNTLEVRG